MPGRGSRSKAEHGDGKPERCGPVVCTGVDRVTNLEVHQACSKSTSAPVGSRRRPRARGAECYAERPLHGGPSCGMRAAAAGSGSALRAQSRRLGVALMGAAHAAGGHLPTNSAMKRSAWARREAERALSVQASCPPGTGTGVPSTAAVATQAYKRRRPPRGALRAVAEARLTLRKLGGQHGGVAPPHAEHPAHQHPDLLGNVQGPRAGSCAAKPGAR